GDVNITADRPLSAQTTALLDDLASKAPVVERTSSIETASMLRPVTESLDSAKRIDLKGVEPNYPLYGTVQLEGEPYSYDLLRDHGVVVSTSLAAQLGLK